jgi:predicted phage tail protein
MAWWASGLAILLWSCGGDSSKGPETATDEVPPDRPAQLRVTKIGDGEIHLTWAAPADSDWSFFVVYRSDPVQRPAPVDTTFAIGFADRGLAYEVEYTYFVTAVDQSGNESPPSNQVSGQPFNTLSPLAPTGARAIAHNIAILEQLEIALDWDANEEADLEGYRVYRSERTDFSGSQRRAAVEKPRFVDQEVQIGARYYYWITAVDLGGKESAPSARVTDVPLPAPVLEKPVEGELTAAMPRFHWRRVAEATGYRVIVTTSPTSGEISDMPLISDTTAVFQGRSQSGGARLALESGQIYYWKVTASTQADGRENSVSRVESFKVR